MDSGSSERNVGAVVPPLGRERELAVLNDHLGARALVLTGAPGIGKTTLWEAGIEAARNERSAGLVGFA